MKFCNLDENIRSSRIVMGCMRIADKPLTQVEEAIIECVRSGVNTFDHADIYGNGDSERMFGVAIRDIGLPRTEYFVQTKCGIRRGEKGGWYDFSKQHILDSVEGSLKRLNMEYLDILLLHRPDALMEPEEVAEAFQTLVESGKVRAFGVSNFSAPQIQLLQSAGIKVVANQMQLSLMHSAMIDEGLNVNTYKDEAARRAGDVLEYCRLNDIALQAWSPMQRGFFGGAFVGDDRLPTLNAALNEMAEKYECTPTTIAIAWILRHPAKIQVVTGSTNVNRLHEACLGASVDLTREDWYALYRATGKTLP